MPRRSGHAHWGGLMPQLGSSRIVEAIGTLLLGGGLGSGAIVIGKVITDYMRARASTAQSRRASEFDIDEKRATAMAARERTIVQEYRHILDEKDAEHDRERAEWKLERSSLVAEAVQLRRLQQRFLVDYESMRLKIEDQRREIARLSGQADDRIGDRLDRRFSAVVLADEMGDIYWANESASLYLRYPLDSMLKMNVDQLVPPSALAAHRRGMEQSRARGVPRRGQIMDRVIRGRALRSDGSEIPTDIVISVFGIKDVILCRAQFMERFDRPGQSVEDMPVYVPSVTSGTGVALPDSAPVPSLPRPADVSIEAQPGTPPA